MLAVVAGAGLLKPGRVLAAGWPKAAFASNSVENALAALYGGNPAGISDRIKLKAPRQAENGAIVQFEAWTDLPEVESISIFVEKNAQPLIASTEFHGAPGFFATRMKMAQTSDVHVVVKAGGKLYRAKQNIKVTVGGG